jgi:hypothetical protein
VPHNTSVVVPLICSDGAGDARRIASVPGHGQLSAIDQTGGTVTYTPTSGYAGPDGFTYVGNDGAMDSPPASISLSVASAASGGTRGASALSRLKITPATFRSAQRGGSIGIAKGKLSPRRPPVGARVTFTLSAATRVRFGVEARRLGTRNGHACVIASPGARSGHTRGRARKPCAKYVPVRGSFTVNGSKGANGFFFTGRLGGHALAAGQYRLVARFGPRGTARTPFRIAHP